MNLFAAIVAVLGFGVSAQTKFHGIPVLWLIAATVTLISAAAVLALLRLLIRDGLCLRPRMVPT